jgi:hypothetical protein
MTQERGFHMKERNWRKTLKRGRYQRGVPVVTEDYVLLRFLLELVGAEDSDTVLSLGVGETTLVTLEELEDLLHDDVLDVDLLLVVEVGGRELDLRGRKR